MFNFDKNFPVVLFADTEVNPTLKESEQSINILSKNKENEDVYSTFNEDFSTYLSKLPDNGVRTHVQNVFNKDLVFIGIGKRKPDNTFIRLALTSDDKLAGILLDSLSLDIDPITGHTNSIDNCVYATYFGLVRAAVLLNKREIRQDKDLHHLMSTYLFLLLIKSIGSDKLYSPKIKAAVHMISIYIYYRHYLKEKHGYAVSIIQREYQDYIGKEYFDELLPLLDKIQGYDSIKDFPKMLIDTRTVVDNPNAMIINMAKLLKPAGFYCLVGPLDYFVALSILTKYPIDFFDKKSIVNEKLQISIEKIINGYIDKIKYATNAIPKS